MFQLNYTIVNLNSSTMHFVKLFLNIIMKNS